MPSTLSKITHEDGDQSKVSENEDLLQVVQDTIEKIKTADSIGEKATIAHAFSNTYIHDQIQGSESDKILSFEKIANNPYGDCEDYARFSTGLLIRGGVNPENISNITGMVTYRIGDSHMTEPHTFVAVRDEDTFLILDNNSLEVTISDAESSNFNIKITDDDALCSKEGTMTVDSIAIHLDGNGVGYFSQENYDKIIAHVNEAEPTKPAVLHTTQLSGQNASLETSVNM